MKLKEILKNQIEQSGLQKSFIANKIAVDPQYINNYTLNLTQKTIRFETFKKILVDGMNRIVFIKLVKKDDFQIYNIFRYSLNDILFKFLGEEKVKEINKKYKIFNNLKKVKLNQKSLGFNSFCKFIEISDYSVQIVIKIPETIKVFNI